MAVSLRASEQGLEKVERARRRKGWTKTEDAWWQSVPTSKSTLKRFWLRKRIQKESFAGICEVVGLEQWEEIVDDSLIQDGEPKQNSEVIRWSIVLSAKIQEVNKARAEAIIAHLKEVLDEPFLTLQKIDEGSVVLVVEGSQEGFEWMEYLFRSGELTELLGVQVLDVQLAPAFVTALVNLSQWLQDVFEEGWQTIEEIFGPRQLAFRSAVVKRAKQIDLGGDFQVVLVVDLPREADEEIDILLRVYPAGDSPKGDRSASRTELPENLKFSLLYESEPGKIEKQEVEVDRGKDCIEQELTIIPGEWFSVKLTLGDVSVTEEFSLR